MLEISITKHRRKITQDHHGFQVKQNETFRTILFISYCASMERLFVCQSAFTRARVYENSKICHLNFLRAHFSEEFHSKIDDSTKHLFYISFHFLFHFFDFGETNSMQRLYTAWAIHRRFGISFYWYSSSLQFSFEFCVFFYFLLQWFFIRHLLLICVFCFLFCSPETFSRSNFVACLAFFSPSIVQKGKKQKKTLVLSLLSLSLNYGFEMRIAYGQFIGWYFIWFFLVLLLLLFLCRLPFVDLPFFCVKQIVCDFLNGRGDHRCLKMKCKVQNAAIMKTFGEKEFTKMVNSEIRETFGAVEHLFKRLDFYKRQTPDLTKICRNLWLSELQRQIRTIVEKWHQTEHDQISHKHNKVKCCGISHIPVCLDCLNSSRKSPVLKENMNRFSHFTRVICPSHLFWLLKRNPIERGNLWNMQFYQEVNKNDGGIPMNGYDICCLAFCVKN